VTEDDSMGAIWTELPGQIASHVFVSITSRYQSLAGA
jgi:hypothetical protein